MSAISGDRGACRETSDAEENGASSALAEDATTQWIIREIPWEDASADEATTEAAPRSPRDPRDPRDPASAAPPKLRSLAAKERAAQLIGRVISDRYVVEDVIAVGGMGCVYRGSHRHMRKRVAIKRLLPETEGLKELAGRFEREAVAGAHINHPNVAAATDFGQLEDGSYFLILEFANGITLHDIIKRGPMPPMRAVRIARQLAAALDAAHYKGVIHRDLKPRNVMIDEDERDFVKLIDFGLAKVLVDRVATAGAASKGMDGGSITGAGVVFGTVAYMAPEAAFGMGYVTDRSDIYALGVILFEMLAGVHPFGGRDPVEIFRLHRQQPAPAIRERAPGVSAPPELEAVVMRMLEKEPDHRYQSAREVLDALDDAMPCAALDFAGPPSSSGGRPSRYSGVVKRWSSPPSRLPPSSTSPMTSALRASVGELSAPSSSRLSPAPELSGQGDYMPRLSRRSAVPRWRARLAVVAVSVVAAAFGVGLRLLATSRERGAPQEARAVIEVGASVPSAAVVEARVPNGPSAAATRDGTALRAALRGAAEAKAWRKAADALIELADADPRAFVERPVINASVSIVTNIELGALDAKRAEDVYQALAMKAGSGGLDALYEVLSTRGRSSAAARAGELLRRGDVMDRATPALKIAMDLREAPCNDKLSLLDRARDDGDLRVVAELDILRSEACNLRKGQCCFPRSPQIEKTIYLVRTRLRGAPR